ncbi:TetR/AcrR family transcriptional regulator [Actinokineospora pegani]|uniref:TetR/AcrR family transcriptional regulator n=1 Tax=Actinokineospora pegani TaxID=2654637 RepID=UPI0012EAA058|nr:TetR/AcrR family transcriptional regulator [Actinokineospora pegani]
MSGRAKAGRPRDPAVDEAILGAALARLANDGYAAMTLGDVAADAGVTRPTLYRRWANKHDLVVDAIDLTVRGAVAGQAPIEVTGLTARDAITEAIRRAAPPWADDQRVGMTGHVIAEARGNPALLAVVREHVVEPQLAALARVLEHLRARGELRAGIDLDVVASLCLGGYLADYVRTGRSDPDLHERLGDAVWAMVRK